MTDLALADGVSEHLAGVGRRAAAVVIDGLVMLPLLAVLFMRYGTKSTEVWTSDTGKTLVEHNWTLGGPGFWLFLVGVLVYSIVMEAWFRATIGKLALGLRVAMADGSPLTLRAVLIRNILRLVDGFLFYLVGAVLAWNSPLRQRLGDRVAGTVVVHRGD
jgi:uncharacterized RDD family membrane protein YckC